MTTSVAELAKIQDDMRGVEGTGVSWFAVLLVVLAVLGGLVGLLFASQATSGVAILAFSILLAVIARIAQAGAQHAALVRALRR